MNWLAAYEIDTDERASDLGEPATLTVIMRDLDTDARLHVFLPVERVVPGPEQKEAILRAMAGRFPYPVWKTSNEEKHAASFVDRRHLCLVYLRRARRRARSPDAQAALVTV